MGLGKECDDVHHATATGTLERVDLEDAPPCGCGIKERPTAASPPARAGKVDASAKAQLDIISGSRGSNVKPDAQAKLDALRADYQDVTLR